MECPPEHNLKDFDFGSINKEEDVYGYDRHSMEFYVLKGFKNNTNNYERISFEIPCELAKAIINEAISEERWPS